MYRKFFTLKSIMSTDQWFLYLSMTAVVSISPGPVMLMCMTNGAQHHYRQVVLGMLGASLGNIVLMVLSAVGLGILIRYWPHAFAVVGVGGAIYLGYLGFNMWRHSNPLAAQPATLSRNTFLTAFYIAVSNPKGILYFGALFPQFIQPQSNLIYQLMLLTVAFLIIDMLVMQAYASGGKWLVQRLQHPRRLRRFNRALALFFMCAAIFMALQQLDLL